MYSFEIIFTPKVFHDGSIDYFHSIDYDFVSFVLGALCPTVNQLAKIINAIVTIISYGVYKTDTHVRYARKRVCGMAGRA